MTFLRLFVCLSLSAGVAHVALGQDIVSGPDVKSKVPAIKVFDVTGMKKGEEADYAAERKDKPTVYLLLAADKFDRPMNRFMKELDKVVKADYADAYIVAVWLTDDEEKTKDFLPKVQQSVAYEATALTCLKDKNGPKDWNVNSDAHITVVVADKGKVAATLGYNSINETCVPKVIEALKKAGGK